MTPNLTVRLLYGIGEGPGLDSRIRNAFASRGLDLFFGATRADVILAHSGGALELPNNLSDKIVILVAPSYGAAGHSIAGLCLRKVWQDLGYLARRGQLGRWAAKTVLNARYFLTQLPRALRMYLAIKNNPTLLPEFFAQQTIIVRYLEDPWSALITPAEAAKYPQYSFIDLPGSHDNLWTNPEPLAQALAGAMLPTSSAAHVTL